MKLASFAPRKGPCDELISYKGSNSKLLRNARVRFQRSRETLGFLLQYVSKQSRVFAEIRESGISPGCKIRLRKALKDSQLWGSPFIHSKLRCWRNY